jgi:Glycosyltransferase family 25 (LPS biosynthesis protein)
MRDPHDLMPSRRNLLQSARRRFGREKLRSTIHRPLAGYAIARRAERIRALRAHGVRVGVDRLPAVSVINLSARPDRLSSFMNEMESLGIENVRRFEAIQDPFGAIGCTRSHACLAREMIDSAWPAAMICEDDLRFHVSREKLDVLVDAFLDDERAEVACLEFNAQKTRRYSRLFLRALETQNAGCYLIKATIAEELRLAFEDGISAMRAGGDPLLYNIDIVWKRLQKSRVFLVPIKRIAYQEPGYSDIERRWVQRDSPGRRH